MFCNYCEQTNIEFANCLYMCWFYSKLPIWVITSPVKLQTVYSWSIHVCFVFQTADLGYHFTSEVADCLQLVYTCVLCVSDCRSGFDWKLRWQRLQVWDLVPAALAGRELRSAGSQLRGEEDVGSRHLKNTVEPSTEKQRYVAVQGWYIHLIIIWSSFDHLSWATVSVKISNILICFCSFDLSCPIFKKDIFYRKIYIVLSCLIK